MGRQTTSATIQRLLEDKRQIVFYGPPGTGKTFVALQLARHFAGAEDAQPILSSSTRPTPTRTSWKASARQTRTVTRVSTSGKGRSSA